MGVTFISELSACPTGSPNRSLAIESASVPLDNGVLLTVVGLNGHRSISNMLKLVTDPADPLAFSHESIHGLLANTFQGNYCISAIIRTKPGHRQVTDERLDKISEHFREFVPGVAEFHLTRLSPTNLSATPLFVGRDLFEYRFETTESSVSSTGLQRSLAKFTAGAKAHDVPVAHFHYPRTSGTPSLVIAVAPSNEASDTTWMDLFAIQCAHDFGLSVTRTASTSSCHMADEEPLSLYEPSDQTNRHEPPANPHATSAMAVLNFTGAAKIGLLNHVLESIRTTTGHYPIAGTATVLAGLTTGSFTITSEERARVHGILTSMSLSVVSCDILSEAAPASGEVAEYWVTWNLPDKPGILLTILDRLAVEAESASARLTVNNILCRTTAPGSRCVGKLRFAVPGDRPLDEDGPGELAHRLRASVDLSFEEFDKVIVSGVEPAGPPWFNTTANEIVMPDIESIIDLNTSEM